MKFSLFILLIQLQFYAQSQIDTNSVIEVKNTTINGVPFRYLPSGVITGKYKIGINSDKLYAVRKQEKPEKDKKKLLYKVLPYEVLRYEFSYMDAKTNKYTVIECKGSSIDPRIGGIINEIEKFSTVSIDKIYAKNIYTGQEIRIGGTNLLKE